MSEQNLSPEPEAKRPAEILSEILALNQEMAKELRFIKNYFRWQVIWGSIKWAIVILVVILGFISLKAMANYLEGYAGVFKSYSEQIESSNQQIDSLKNLINIKGR